MRSDPLQDASFSVGLFIEPPLNDHDAPLVLTPKDLPAVFAERFRHHETAQPGFGSMWTEINTRLTAIGGKGVWLEGYVNAALPHVLTAGELVPEGVVIVQGPGRPNECHASVMAICESGQLLCLFRGYALHPESGYWLSHSWGMDRRGQLVETTTVKWSRYYGAPWRYRGKFEEESSPERQRRAAEKRALRAERNRRHARRPEANKAAR